MRKEEEEEEEVELSSENSPAPQQWPPRGVELEPEK
jgi:hypothetical protein